MPAVRHAALGLHPLEGDLDGDVPMAGQRDLAMGTRAWCEGTFKLHTEPGAELFGVGKRAPNTRAGCAQHDLFLDAVCGVMQLHGCILRRPHQKCNRRIAYPPSLLRGLPPGTVDRYVASTLESAKQSSATIQHERLGDVVLTEPAAEGVTFV